MVELALVLEATPLFGCPIFASAASLFSKCVMNESQADHDHFYAKANVGISIRQLNKNAGSFAFLLFTILLMVVQCFLLCCNLVYSGYFASPCPCPIPELIIIVVQ
jgi:hypothetical protein